MQSFLEIFDIYLLEAMVNGILLGGLLCQGTNEVVCFVEMIHEHRQTERTRRCLTLLQLPGQVWWGEGTIGFIVREKSIAEG